MEKQQVILVDEHDNTTGTMEKMEAHEKGLLHRAFSVFVFNSKGQMLLQQRALKKYHSGGLWTNACCSHPNPGEEINTAAHRRLEEELGFDTDLQKIFDFVYCEKVGKDLIEHEFDHVFTGQYEGQIRINRDEVMDTCYKTITEIREDLDNSPELYTTWFRIAFPRVEEWWQKRI